MFDDYDELRRMKVAWDSVKIARPVHYSLFTFGESKLEYYLVSEPEHPSELVKIRRGEVKVTRPIILRPGQEGAEFLNFFDDDDATRSIEFLLSRSAAFSNLRFSNATGPEKIVSDSVEEAVARLRKQLDDEEEDQIAILVAPTHLTGLAILRYTVDRVLQSAPDNVQELRERGFLGPD